MKKESSAEEDWHGQTRTSLAESDQMSRRRRILRIDNICRKIRETEKQKCREEEQRSDRHPRRKSDSRDWMRRGDRASGSIDPPVSHRSNVMVDKTLAGRKSILKSKRMGDSEEKYPMERNPGTKPKRMRSGRYDSQMMEEKQGWERKWAGLGRPYYGNMVRGVNIPMGKHRNPDCSDVVGSPGWNHRAVGKKVGRGKWRRKDRYKRRVTLVSANNPDVTNPLADGMPENIRHGRFPWTQKCG